MFDILNEIAKEAHAMGIEPLDKSAAKLMKGFQANMGGGARRFGDGGKWDLQGGGQGGRFSDLHTINL